MHDADVITGQWPPAFSPSFVASARQLLADTDHVMIVGSLGSGRGALASAITGPSAAAVWGRDTHGFATTGVRYTALNLLLPTLRAPADRAVTDVIADAEAVLATTFGRQTFTLREADLCDDGTIDVLAHLVEHGRIALVSTVDPASAHTHRLARNASRIDLTPLDEDTIERLLTERFGVPPHPTTVLMLAARSQGAYAVLRKLADVGFATGQIKVISGLLVTDDTVSVDDVDSAVDATRHRWPPRFPADHPARDVLDVAALTVSIDADEAVTAFGSDAVESAIASGAVQRRGTRVVFASRAEAAVLRRDLGQERRTALHRLHADRLRVTATLDDVSPRMAAWVMSVDRSLPVDLAVRAASRANRECRYVDALQFIDAVPAPARPSKLLVEQCHALSESGADAEVTALLRSIRVDDLHVDDLFPVMRWMSRYLTPDETSAAFAALRRRADRDDDDAVRATMTLMELYREVYRSGSDDVRLALQALSSSGRLSPANRALAHVALASWMRHASRAEHAVEAAREAVALLDQLDDVSACHVEAAMEIEILCLVTAGDLAGARDSLITYSSPGVGYGKLGRLGTYLWGLVAFFSGDVRAAMAHAQLCLSRTPSSDPHRLRAWLEAMAAQILTQVGDIDEVYELLEASYRHPADPRLQHDMERRLTQACVHDAIGEPEEALEILQRIVEEAREHELRLEEVDAAVLCVQIGGPVHLPALLRAVEGVDETCGTSVIWQRFAYCIRDNDMRGLVTLAEELDFQGRLVFAAEVAQFTLDVARRAADMTPEQRRRLVTIADPMQHRTVTR